MTDCNPWSMSQFGQKLSHAVSTQSGLAAVKAREDQMRQLRDSTGAKMQRSLSGNQSLSNPNLHASPTGHPRLACVSGEDESAVVPEATPQSVARGVRTKPPVG
jgi:hypothetical protein